MKDSLFTADEHRLPSNVRGILFYLWDHLQEYISLQDGRFGFLMRRKFDVNVFTTETAWKQE